MRRLDAQDLHLDGPSWLRERLPDPGLGRRIARAGLDLRSRLPPRGAGRARKAEGGRALRVDGPCGPIDAEVWTAQGARAQLVVSVAGTLGGRALGLSFLGLSPAQLAGTGWTVWLYDRGGTGRTKGECALAPGTARHADEAGAIFRRAQEEGLPTAWLSFSGGLIAALMAETDPWRVIDAEAPADRLSLRPRPRGLERQAFDLHVLERHHMAEVAQPQPWEPFRLVGALRCPYHRLQAAEDHMHGHTVTHARALLASARDPWLNGAPWRGDPVTPWPGRLADSGQRTLAFFKGLLPR